MTMSREGEVFSSQSGGGLRARILGVDVHTMDMDQTIDHLRDLIASGVSHNHLSLNAAKAVAAFEDEVKLEEFNQASVVSPDGQAIVWASRLLGCPLPQRVAGIDVMDRLVELSAREGQRIFLLGAREDVVGRARREFTARGANVVGHRDGYWRRHMTDAEMAETIRLLEVDILFVALPSPMKEDFIYGFRDAMSVGLSVGVGGSFDVVAGRTRRAPRFMQKLGLEWLHRMLMEPRRMFRRYAVGNTKFIWYLLRQRFSRGR